VQFLPILSNKFHIAGYSIAIYKLLQHGSTVIGAIVILMCLYKNKYAGEIEKNIVAGQKVLYFAMVTLFSMILTYSIIQIFFGGLSKSNIGIIIVTITNSIFLGLILTSIISRNWPYRPWRSGDYKKNFI